MSSLWETAKVAEPMGLDESEHAGTFIINTNEATILSLNPAEDFEINTNVVQTWRIMFVDDERVFGELDYATTITKLRPFQLDAQNGSILVRPLTHEEIESLL